MRCITFYPRPFCFCLLFLSLTFVTSIFERRGCAEARRKWARVRLRWRTWRSFLRSFGQCRTPGPRTLRDSTWTWKVIFFFSFFSVFLPLDRCCGPTLLIFFSIISYIMCIVASHRDLSEKIFLFFTTTKNAFQFLWSAVAPGASPSVHNAEPAIVL